MESTASHKPVKRWIIILKRIALTVITLFVVWIAAVTVLCMVSIYHPKPFDEKRLDRIIGDIQSSKLKPSGSIVLLPPDLAGASATGRAYVTEGSVFIPSWMGRHQLVCGPCDSCDEWTGGYLSSQSPLKANSFSEIGPINLPNFCKPWQATKDSSAQSMEIFVQRQRGNQWYQVMSGNLPACF